MQIYYPNGDGGRKVIVAGSDYVLPTMSESIKGGAMVGDGLSMNGDTLRAPYHKQIPNIINRVAQTETNIGNLFMQLDSVGDALAGNLLGFEDFKDCKFVDLYNVKVLETVGGPDDLYVESLDGILVGHWYVITDGVRSRYLRVKAIATNDGLCNVMFEEPINITFNLKKTYLRRTTAKVVGGQLNASSDIKEKNFYFDAVWQGVPSSVSKTHSFALEQKYIKNFELIGEGTFTPDGFFTLS